MLSKDEKKQVRVEFWDSFNKLSARRRKGTGRQAKWILEYTGIKQLKLKFHFDETHAIVGIDVDTVNLDKKVEIFDKLEKLKTLMEKAMGEAMIWDLEHEIEGGKKLSRVFLRMDNVDIFDKNCWGEVTEFMYKNMLKLEDFFIEYRDYLRYL